MTTLQCLEADKLIVEALLRAIDVERDEALACAEAAFDLTDYGGGSQDACVRAYRDVIGTTEADLLNEYLRLEEVYEHLLIMIADYQHPLFTSE